MGLLEKIVKAVGPINIGPVHIRYVENDEEEQPKMVRGELPYGARPFGIDAGPMMQRLGCYYAGSANTALIRTAITNANALIDLVRYEFTWAEIRRFSPRNVFLVDEACDIEKLRSGRVCVAILPNGPTETGRAPKYQCEVDVIYQEPRRIYDLDGSPNSTMPESIDVRMYVLPDGSVGKASAYYGGNLCGERLREHYELRMASGELRVAKAVQGNDAGNIHEFKA